jgi:hypothetical protein
MHSSRRALAMLGLLLWTGVAVAADGGAPLEQSKQELQKLRGEQKVGGAPAAGEGLKTDMPSLNTPANAAPSYEQYSKETRKKEKAGKNWLVDGMARLGGDAPDRARTATADAVRIGDPATGQNQEEAAKIETDDPAFLLKTYERTKQQEKGRTERTAHTKHEDAVAPFMQEWLAKSPVRDQVLEGLGKENRGGSLAVESPGSRPAAGEGVSLLNDGISLGAAASPVASPALKPNPYLVDPILSPQAMPPAGPVPNLPAVPKPIVVPAAPPATPAPGSAPEVAPAARNPLPPALSDDRKYFPQLKKF